MNDSLSDMFVRIRNAYKAGKPSVIVQHSELKNEILRVFKDGGFIKDVEKKGKKIKKFLEIILKYEGDTPALSGIERVSKSSRRMYVRKEDIKKTNKGIGILIISTSKGVMTDKDAIAKGVGGELIAKVW